MAAAVGEATGAGVFEAVSSSRLHANRNSVNEISKRETRFIEIIDVEFGRNL
jgi:hypothetical protein